MLKILRTEHPRLYIYPEKLKEIKELQESDAFFRELKGGLINRADRLTFYDPVEFKITGLRMLKNCQKILSRVSTLALAYHLTEDYKYALRAKEELISAADFPHWNKDHFLDTAELITAFAIGYDWLFHVLSKTDLLIIKSAMINQGLKTGLEEYKNNIWWAKHKYNWNQVCNGALIIGSLVIGDEEPQLASEIFRLTTKNLPIAFNSYGKDGGWEAGPDYWQYTTWYSALLIDALQSVTGNDLDLLKTKGFDKTGLFPVYSAGPNDQYFNFADADEDFKALPVLFWLGKQFNIETCILENHRLLKKSLKHNEDLDAFNLIWYQPVVKSPQPLPVSRLFRDINILYMRSEWAKKEAIFTTLKGGFNQADHAHLDLGSFILDMNGVRWASELGRDNYDLPNYFDLSEGGGRWNYFRLNTKSHNTLVLNNDNQRALAKSEIVNFHASTDESAGAIDLSEAYVPHAKSVFRTIILLKNDGIIVKDKIEWAGPQKLIQWQMLTDAKITLLGRKAELRKGGKTIYATLHQPDDAVFEVISAERMEPEAHNRDFKQLIVKKTEKGNSTEISVSLCNKP
jgi:hypothetical protein